MDTPAPKRKRRARALTAEQRTELRELLELVRRLRVVTAPQAHWLFAPFRAKSSKHRRPGAKDAPKTERSTYLRLQTLVSNDFLQAERVDPSAGVTSPLVFRLTYKALGAIGRQGELSALQRPTPRILEYLVYRNELYAEARRAGWFVASPVLHPAEAHERFLKRYHHAVLAPLRAAVKSVEALTPAAPLALERARDALREATDLLPKELTFDFLERTDAKGNSLARVLLVLDDPRKAIATQIEQLPAHGWTHVLVRDVESRFDPLAGELLDASPRLRALRRQLGQRIGVELVDRDTLATASAGAREVAAKRAREAQAASRVRVNELDAELEVLRRRTEPDAAGKKRLAAQLEDANRRHAMAASELEGTTALVRDLELLAVLRASGEHLASIADRELRRARTTAKAAQEALSGLQKRAAGMAPDVRRLLESELLRLEAIASAATDALRTATTAAAEARERVAQELGQTDPNLRFRAIWNRAAGGAAADHARSTVARRAPKVDSEDPLADLPGLASVVSAKAVLP